MACCNDCEGDKLTAINSIACPTCKVFAWDLAKDCPKRGPGDHWHHPRCPAALVPGMFAHPIALEGERVFEEFAEARTRPLSVYDGLGPESVGDCDIMHPWDCLTTLFDQVKKIPGIGWVAEQAEDFSKTTVGKVFFAMIAPSVLASIFTNLPGIGLQIADTLGKLGPVATDMLPGLVRGERVDKVFITSVKDVSLRAATAFLGAGMVGPAISGLTGPALGKGVDLATKKLGEMGIKPEEIASKYEAVKKDMKARGIPTDLIEERAKNWLIDKANEAGGLALAQLPAAGETASRALIQNLGVTPAQLAQKVDAYRIRAGLRKAEDELPPDLQAQLDAELAPILATLDVRALAKLAGVADDVMQVAIDGVTRTARYNPANFDARGNNIKAADKEIGDAFVNRLTASNAADASPAAMDEYLEKLNVDYGKSIYDIVFYPRANPILATLFGGKLMNMTPAVIIPAFERRRLALAKIIASIPKNSPDVMRLEGRRSALAQALENERVRGIAEAAQFAKAKVFENTIPGLKMRLGQLASKPPTAQSAQEMGRLAAQIADLEKAEIEHQKRLAEQKVFEASIPGLKLRIQQLASERPSPQQMQEMGSLAAQIAVLENAERSRLASSGPGMTRDGFFRFYYQIALSL